MPKWRLLATAAALLLAGAVLTGEAPAVPPPGEAIALTGWQGHGYPSRPPTFTIRVAPTGLLYPGTTRSLSLTITNPHPYAIRVRTITGRPVSTSKPGCRPVTSNLEVRPYRGRLPLVVDALSRRDAGQLEIHMPNSVVDACQRAHFVIHIDSEAVQVNR